MRFSKAFHPWDEEIERLYPELEPLPNPYHPFERPNRPEKLTYIFGARCKNGVVLVADRKVTIEGTGRSRFQEKLFIDVYPVVWGSAGSQKFSDSFNNRVNIKVRDFSIWRPKKKDKIGIQDFRLIMEDVYDDMVKRYGDYLRHNLSILMAHSANKKAELWHINQFGAAEQQNGYAGIGSGTFNADLFTRDEFFEPDKLTMIEAAQYGYFIIKYIEKLRLDHSVGVGKQRPQVWFLPDNGEEEKAGRDPKRYQPTPEQLDEIESNTRKRLRRLRVTLSKFWTVS